MNIICTPGEEPCEKSETYTHTCDAHREAKRDRGEKFLLIDVREPWEVQLVGLKEAMHIPMEDIPWRVEELNREDEIVVFCHTGVRSGMVTQWLRAQGFERVWNLQGGIDAWARTVDPSLRRY